MPEIGTSSSMSGDGKRSDGLRPQATAPILDSTRIAVGMPVAGHPPHRSGQARFEHPALTLSIDGEAPVWPGMKDARRGKPAGDQLRHSVPREAVFLAAPPKRAAPEVGHVMPER